jgi:hypothetical protein
MGMVSETRVLVLHRSAERSCFSFGRQRKSVLHRPCQPCRKPGSSDAWLLVQSRRRLQLQFTRGSRALHRRVGQRCGNAASCMFRAPGAKESGVFATILSRSEYEASNSLSAAIISLLLLALVLVLLWGFSRGRQVRTSSDSSGVRNLRGRHPCPARQMPPTQDNTREYDRPANLSRRRGLGRAVLRGPRSTRSCVGGLFGAMVRTLPHADADFGARG